ncbi:hypothetical protein ABZ249_23745 [Nocardiopsis sp. NPDC006139]|uniref:hypothetical protein n=1 Tax=Nocardiopsis sp. NPDC006139 TaxID=3154578 RepID=UPI0033A212F4
MRGLIGRDETAKALDRPRAGVCPGPAAAAPPDHPRVATLSALAAHTVVGATVPCQIRIPRPRVSSACTRRTPWTPLDAA